MKMEKVLGSSKKICVGSKRPKSCSEKPFETTRSHLQNKNFLFKKKQKKEKIHDWKMAPHRD